MDGPQSPLPTEEACSHCGFVPYILAAAPVVLPLLLLLLSGPLLILLGWYMRTLNGDKRTLLLRAAYDEVCHKALPAEEPPRLTTIVGFFHPYCNAGGGGERVLWAAIHANQQRHPHVLNVVYTGDQASKSTILSNVRLRFDIPLDPTHVQFIHLQKRYLVSASTWPRLTLLMQSVGSLFLAAEAFAMLVPDVYIDTMGYAFTVLLAKRLFAIPTAAYVHYPTISTDMLGSLSPGKNRIKRWYWQLFALIYSYTGRGIDVVVANSSWTAGHLNALWRGRVEPPVPPFGRLLSAAVGFASGGGRGKREGVDVLFPPCAVKKLADAIPLDAQQQDPRENVILYIAQFRPEKNHVLVLHSFQKFLATAPEELKGTRLVLVGSVRADQDEKKVYELRLLAHELQIEDNVLFATNSPWPDVIGWLGRASIGVNAMWNEHFGIGVVEYQAAGLICVVHDSGGPKMDIVVEVDGYKTGYHATTADEFAAGFLKALSLGPVETAMMRARARQSAMRFSEEIFEDKWNAVMDSLLGKRKSQ
ncbi:hypothetical protein DRE_04910 [Drechslerella stenobrocha 248]|uniref:GDP-Man:Man(3)GlcNAc(2)-PP-Dol alpha-1,2-mannosyltransferase n=1 Tax=Drechslerella stenobrocha 248 TaxID=1043628 RepID=W7I100_9PEZI|nr:hypothetical protein DRE_04910 [Drechslerella stenobrocha 248]